MNLLKTQPTVTEFRIASRNSHGVALWYLLEAAGEKVEGCVYKNDVESAIRLGVPLDEVARGSLCMDCNHALRSAKYYGKTDWSNELMRKLASKWSKALASKIVEKIPMIFEAAAAEATR